MPVFSCGGDWPVITEADIRRFEKATRKRVGKVVPNLLHKYKSLSGIAGFLFLNRMVAGNVINTVVKKLKEHGLIVQ